MNIYEKEIADILDKRYPLVYKKVKGKQVEEYTKKVQALLRRNFDHLSVDFIVESLTHLGDAPNIVYDDNGLFAVSGDGYQPVVTGRQKIDGVISVAVEKPWWQKTIRLALTHYLSRR